MYNNTDIILVYFNDQVHSTVRRVDKSVTMSTINTIATTCQGICINIYKNTWNIMIYTRIERKTNILKLK